MLAPGESRPRRRIVDVVMMLVLQEPACAAAEPGLVPVRARHIISIICLNSQSAHHIRPSGLSFRQLEYSLKEKRVDTMLTGCVMKVV